MPLFYIKLLAVLSMLCDHISKTMGPLAAAGNWLPPEQIYWIRIVLESFGRMALPVFLWCAAEGCRHTRSPGKYLGRLLLFALLSEIPFRLAFLYPGMKLTEPGCRNVIFTIFLGNAAILLPGFVPEGRGRRAAKAGLAAGALLAAWVLHTDYHAFGVALLLLLYYSPKKLQWAALLLWCLVFYIPVQLYRGYPADLRLVLRLVFSLLSCPLILAYNGEKGRNGKWWFYVFYPAHLLLLGVLRLAG